jgi:hypothetical protein
MKYNEMTEFIRPTVPKVPPSTRFIIRKTPTGFFMPIWPTMHINSLLAMVETVLMLTLMGTINLLLKTMNDLFLFREKTASGDQEYRIWRDSMHHGRNISMVSVVPDRLEPGQGNQALNSLIRKSFGWLFLSCEVYWVEASSFRFES